MIGIEQQVANLQGAVPMVLVAIFYLTIGVMIGVLIGPLLVELHLDAKRKHP